MKPGQTGKKYAMMSCTLQRKYVYIRSHNNNIFHVYLKVVFVINLIFCQSLIVSCKGLSFTLLLGET